MELSLQQILAVMGWVLWCGLHSGLISLTVTGYLKERLGPGFRFYRLSYCVFSLVTLLPLLYYTTALRPEPFFRWDGYLAAVPYALILTVGALFVAGARQYRFIDLLGIRQARRGLSDPPPGGDTLVVSGLHNAIRHPWYVAGILVVWAQDLSLFTILNNTVISLYFVIGSYLEERKMVREFGERYREYRRTVSMFLPYQWLKAKVGGY